MQPELKSCPFCRASDKAHITNVRDGAEVNCRCGASMVVFNPDSRTRVVAAWNTRATTPPEAEVRAELIVPCPYASVNPNDNQGINFFVKSYPEYYDIVELQNNRPARCIRVALQPFNTGRE